MFKEQKEKINDPGIQIQSPEDAIRVFKTYWPYLKKLIETVKVFSGMKAKVFLDRIIEAGEMLAK